MTTTTFVQRPWDAVKFGFVSNDAWIRELPLLLLVNDDVTNTYKVIVFMLFLSVQIENTALFKAVLSDRVEVVALLLKAGADVNVFRKVSGRELCSC